MTRPGYLLHSTDNEWHAGQVVGVIPASMRAMLHTEPVSSYTRAALLPGVRVRHALLFFILTALETDVMRIRAVSIRHVPIASFIQAVIRAPIRHASVDWSADGPHSGKANLISFVWTAEDSLICALPCAAAKLRPICPRVQEFG